MKLLPRLVLVATVFAMSTLAVTAEAAPVFLNASFEDSVFSCSPTAAPVNWIANAGSWGILNPGCYGDTPYGNQFVGIGAIEDGGTSYLEQTVSGFIPGNMYVLSWAQHSEYVTSDKVRVTFLAGSPTLGQTFTSVPAPGCCWEDISLWQTMSMQFLASASSVTFHFQSFADNYEPGVDNFQLQDVGPSQVPEPMSLLLVGTGVVGLVRRRLIKQ